MLGIIRKLINNNKETREKIIIGSKFYILKKENEILKNKGLGTEKNVDPFD